MEAAWMDVEEMMFERVWRAGVDVAGFGESAAARRDRLEEARSSPLATREGDVRRRSCWKR